MKMSKPGLINSTSEDKNNGTEEKETSNDEYLFQSYNRTSTNPVFQKNLWKKTAQEKNHQIQKETLVRLEKRLLGETLH